MRPHPIRALPALALLTLLACEPSATAPALTFTDDFQGESGAWVAGFSDVDAALAEHVQFEGTVVGHPLHMVKLSLYLYGNNISDDLFMFWKRRVEGLVPGASYDVRMELDYATQYQDGCDAGVGPAVLIKMGASTQEPRVVEIADGSLRMTIDKGEQFEEGSAIRILGDHRNGVPGCATDAPFAERSRSSGARSVRVTADNQGAVWVIVGTESAFEVANAIHFSRVRYVFRRVE
jgi:hypothetical protein